MLIYLINRVSAALAFVGLIAGIFERGGWQAAFIALMLLAGMVFVFTFAVMLALMDSATPPEPPRRASPRGRRQQVTETPAPAQRRAESPAPRAAHRSPAPTPSPVLG